MAKKTLSCSALLLLSMFCFLTQTLAARNPRALATQSLNGENAKDPDCLFPGFPRSFLIPPFPPHLFPHPWPFALPPLPAGVPEIPHYPWPFAHPPLPAGFRIPKFPIKPWPFAHPPLPAGFPKWPKLPLPGHLAYPPLPAGFKIPPWWRRWVPTPPGHA